MCVCTEQWRSESVCVCILQETVGLSGHIHQRGSIHHLKAPLPSRGGGSQREHHVLLQCASVCVCASVSVSVCLHLSVCMVSVCPWMCVNVNSL